MYEKMNEEINYTPLQSVALETLGLAALSLSSLSHEELTTLAENKRFQINLMCLKAVLDPNSVKPVQHQ